MAIWLIDDEHVLTFKIPLADVSQEALKRQWLRLSTAEEHQSFSRRLVEGIGAGLESALDNDLRSPTKHQVAYATAIAKTLGVPLPSDVLRFRGAMGSFLDRYAETFKRAIGVGSSLTSSSGGDVS